MITRRGFLERLAGVLGVAAAAPVLARLPAAPYPAASWRLDATTGISIRLDLLYGLPWTSPAHGVEIEA